jgi:glycosyltransferase involved in cell wall biosynthesis
MADEDLVLELDPLAEECMTLDLAVRADDDPSLDLYERTDVRIVANAAAVEVGERAHDNIPSEVDLVDETKRSIVHRRMHHYIRHVLEEVIRKLVRPPPAGTQGNLIMRLITYTDTRELGGADLSLMHLLAFLEPEIEATVMGVSPRIVERIAAARPGTRTLVVPRPSNDHDWRTLATHVSALRGLRPDVLHASLASPWSCQYAIAAAALVRRPRVVAVYQLPMPPVNRRQRMTKRVTSRAVDRHVGVGVRTSREVEDLIGLRAGSVRTIHNGVPDVEADAAPRLATGPIVGAVGRLAFQKGFYVLLRAMRDVDNATVVIVGDGEDRGQLEALARRLGVADRTIWAGWSDDVRSQVRSFDVFALPSRFEGFPLAVLEALLAERPVVAADVGSVGEAVIQGETGFLVRPDDPGALAAALRQLIGDSELQRRMGARGRRLVLGRFTARDMARSFSELYAELLE